MLASVFQLAVTFFSGAIVAVVLSKHHAPRSKCFIFLSIFIFLYSLGYLFETVSGTPDAAFLGSRLLHSAMPFVALFHYLFAREYHYKNLRSRPVIALLLAYPICNAVLLLLDDAVVPTSLFYSRAAFYTLPFPHLETAPGPLLYLAAAYIYVMVALSCIVILQNFCAVDKIERHQSMLFFVCSLLPILAFTGHILGFRVHYYDFTSLTLTLTAFVVEVHILRFRVADWMPYARESVLENIQEAFVLLDVNNLFLDANAVAKSYFPALSGLSAGKPLDGIPAFPRELLQQDAASGEMSIIQEGHVRHLLASRSPIEYDGRPVCYSIMIYDVTGLTGLLLDIERIMRAVRGGYLDERADPDSYDGEYQKIVLGVNTTLNFVCRQLDALPECIAFMSPDGWIRSCNVKLRKFCDIHWMDSEGGTLLGDLLHDVDATPETLLATGSVFQRDIELDSPAGLLTNYTLTIMRMASPSDTDPTQTETDCFALIIKDITTLTRARVEAETASRAKGDFLSRMSHEIRTPVNAIVGMTQIGKTTRDQEKIHNCLQKIETSSNHLIGIINDILDFSKIEAGKMHLDEEPFSLPASIRFVESMFQDRLREKDIRLELELENLTNNEVVADPLRLNQVMINLLSNAVKFTGEGGRVTLRLNEQSHEAGTSVFLFTIADNGIGIDPEQAERLFDPFEQAGKNVATRYGGTGLGLAISKNIVEMMGGRIWVESAPGKGSAFHFTIRVPARPGSAAPPAAEAKPQPLPDFSGKRVLVVDDIEINREILLELLADTGLEMETATDGRQALEMVAGAKPGYYDLVLMDIQMPVMDGCTATRQIRTSGVPGADTLKIIAMTANVMKADIQKAFDSGMDGHLPKPIEFEQVLDTLASNL